MSQLPNICKGQAQGHVLIADWSLPIDVMTINEGCCPFRRLFGRILSLNQIFRKQCTVRKYTTLNLSNQSALEIRDRNRIRVRLKSCTILAFLRRIRNMSTLSSANVMDVNLVLKYSESTHKIKK